MEEALWAIAFVLLWMLMFKDMSGKEELRKIKKELETIAERMKKEE